MPGETRATPTEILRKMDICAEEMLLRQIYGDLRAQSESHFCLVEECDEKEETIYQQFPRKLSKSYW